MGFELVVERSECWFGGWTDCQSRERADLHLCRQARLVVCGWVGALAFVAHGADDAGQVYVVRMLARARFPFAASAPRRLVAAFL